MSTTSCSAWARFQSTRTGASSRPCDNRRLPATRWDCGRSQLATGLDTGILVGYKRWFVDHTRHPGVAKAWLGTDPLRRIGEWVDTVDESGRRVRRRANLDFPAEAARRVVDTQVYPEMIKVCPWRGRARNPEGGGPWLIPASSTAWTSRPPGSRTTTDFDWQVRPDLGPVRMQAKDLMLTISVADWRPWHDGCMVRCPASRFTMMVHLSRRQRPG